MIYDFNNISPKLDKDSWFAPNSVLIGNVTLKKTKCLEAIIRCIYLRECIKTYTNRIDPTRMMKKFRGSALIYSQRFSNIFIFNLICLF